MNESAPEQPDSLDEQQKKEWARGKINIIMQHAYMMGANDYEIPAFNKLLAQVDSGEIDPDAAVDIAQQILDNKQDYH